MADILRYIIELALKFKIIKHFKLTLGLLLIENDTFNIILESKVLQISDYVNIIYKRPEIVVLTTIGRGPVQLSGKH